MNRIWSIPIDDYENDQFSWTIQCSNGQANNGTGATNGIKALSLSGLTNSTTYKVWVNATDPTPTGSGLYTRKWYTFATKSSGETENKKPIANTSAGEPYQCFVNSEITFDGSKSYDSDGNIASWSWDFGDGTKGSGEIITHIYLSTGTFQVILTVTDDDGATNTDTTTCIISQIVTQPNRTPTKPIITGKITGSTNTQYTYTVVSTDPDNDTIQYTFDWGESATQSSGFLPNGTSYTVNHSWTTPGQYTLTVTVTDNQTEASSSMTININEEEKKPSTPGFELVFVICAIALIFLSKRK